MGCASDPSKATGNQLFEHDDSVHPAVVGQKQFNEQ